jgi:hypothetical protein
MAKEPQKTNDGKRAPPRVADGPPPGPGGREAYDEETLERSADYAEERSDDAGKPYSTETEAYRSGPAKPPAPKR